MLTFEGAKITEQGNTFAIVIVKESVIDNKSRADEEIIAYQQSVFPGIPVVLMAQDSRGTPRYYGNSNIVDFLATVNPRRIPWERFTLR